MIMAIHGTNERQANDLQPLTGQAGATAKYAAALER